MTLCFDQASKGYTGKVRRFVPHAHRKKLHGDTQGLRPVDQRQAHRERTSQIRSGASTCWSLGGELSALFLSAALLRTQVFSSCPLGPLTSPKIAEGDG